MKVTDSLAIYRLTRLAIWDGFPPVARLRDRFLRKMPRDSAAFELFTCPWCLSFWIALIVILFKKAFPRIWSLFAPALAASAVTGLLSDGEDALMRARGL